MSSESTDVVRIGAGSFATVYVQQGRNCFAMKVLADPSRRVELLKEFDDLQLLNRLKDNQSLFSFPTPLAHFGSVSDFQEKFQISLGQENMLSSFYGMERVWPVPERLANLIRLSFFPESFKDNKQHFVSRIYLGKPCGESSRFFNPLNFPLDAKRLSALPMSMTTDNIAFEMGKTLSKIHYAVRRDGRDIEFVLGGSPHDPFGGVGFYCIDFNQMRPWNEVQQLVDSFKSNDPYYPRPGQDYWHAFQMGYRAMLKAGGPDADTAENFLDVLKSEYVAAS